MRRTERELLKLYPTMINPMDCENGCGAVVELADAFCSYKKDEHRRNLLICQCCAAEEWSWRTTTT